MKEVIDITGNAGRCRPWCTSCWACTHTHTHLVMICSPSSTSTGFQCESGNVDQADDHDERKSGLRSAQCNLRTIRHVHVSKQLHHHPDPLPHSFVNGSDVLLSYDTSKQWKANTPVQPLRSSGAVRVLALPPWWHEPLSPQTSTRPVATARHLPSG